MRYRDALSSSYQHEVEPPKLGTGIETGGGGSNLMDTHYIYRSMFMLKHPNTPGLFAVALYDLFA
jgi:hypothetical protein